MKCVNEWEKVERIRNETEQLMHNQNFQPLNVFSLLNVRYYSR